jgi:hypothetical protein
MNTGMHLGTPSVLTSFLLTNSYLNKKRCCRNFCVFQTLERTVTRPRLNQMFMLLTLVCQLGPIKTMFYIYSLLHELQVNTDLGPNVQ